MSEIQIVNAGQCLIVSGPIGYKNDLMTCPTAIDFGERLSRLLEILFVIMKIGLFIVAILQMSEGRKI